MAAMWRLRFVLLNPFLGEELVLIVTIAWWGSEACVEPYVCKYYNGKCTTVLILRRETADSVDQLISPAVLLKIMILGIVVKDFLDKRFDAEREREGLTIDPSGRRRS
jgi:hypothetical protein